MSWSVYRLAGKAPLPCLQSQVCQDTQRLSPKSLIDGGLLTRQGRVRCSMLVGQDAGGEIYFAVPTDVAPDALDALNPTLRLARLVVHEHPDLTVYAANAGTIDSLMSAPLNRAAFQSDDSATVQITIGPQPCEDRLTWAEADQRCGATLSGYHVIAAGTSLKFLPHELLWHVDGRASLTKGCYLGQEIVARMQGRRAGKKTLCHFQTSTVSITDIALDPRVIYACRPIDGFVTGVCVMRAPPMDNPKDSVLGTVTAVTPATSR